VAESLVRASGISLGASGVGLVKLCHREDLVIRQSGRQKEGRREAPRQASRRVPRLRAVGRLLCALNDLFPGGCGRGRSCSCFSLFQAR
jgi:hypothetical protein